MCIAARKGAAHDDVIKWKHFPRYWPFVRGIHRSPVNSPHKGQGRGALMLSLIGTWINGWVNNREACDLRRHQVHYDVNVMGVFTTEVLWGGNGCHGTGPSQKSHNASDKWGLCYQKQISQAGISTYIPQLTVGCNYLSLPEIPASGNKVLKYPTMHHFVTENIPRCTIL